MGDYLEYLGFRLLQEAASRVSFRAASRFGAGLGRLGWSLRIRRTVTMENLRRAFPEASSSDLRRIARGAFASFGRTMLVMLWTTGKSADDIVSSVRPFDGDVIRRVRDRGRGIIMMSGHLGCWELMPPIVNRLSGIPLTSIAHEQKNRRVDGIINGIRNRFGNRIVLMSNAPREVLSVLKGGGGIGILADQSGPREALFVDFFGHPAATYRGPAIFSLKTGAPIVFMGVLWRPDETYDVRLEEVATGGIEGAGDDAVAELTRRYTAVLERFVRDNPDQWLWMHKRWKHTDYYRHRQAGAPSTFVPS